MTHPTLFIAMPAFGQMNNSQTTASLVALTKELAEHGMFQCFSSWTLPDLPDLRDLFLTAWFDGTNATHLLFVDADMQFEPDLVKDMILADKPLVGCLYPKKRLPSVWVGSSLTPPAAPQGNLLELEGIGCGVMLIRRDCIQAMLEHGAAETIDELGDSAIEDFIKARGGKRIIRAFQKIKVAGTKSRYLSEDFSFCHRYRQAGGKVYAVINHTLCHIGLHQYMARYSDLYKDVKTETESAAA